MKFMRHLGAIEQWLHERCAKGYDRGGTSCNERKRPRLGPQHVLLSYDFPLSHHTNIFPHLIFLAGLRFPSAPG
ncbi:MAG: hypothetical protein ACK56F_25320, partial [bacterium]